MLFQLNEYAERGIAERRVFLYFYFAENICIPHF